MIHLKSKEMKRYIKSLYVLPVLAVLTSCLKEDPIMDPSGSQNIIEFWDAVAPSSPVGSVYPLYSFAVDLAPEATVPLVISYSGAIDAAPQDITVNLEFGTQAELDQYNEEQGTAYELLPASIASLASPTATIAKGQKKDTVMLKMKAELFDFSKSYALPVRIKSSSFGIVSGNFGTVIYAINVKNKYDGIYTVTGTFEDLTAATSTARYPRTIHLITMGANSVAYFDPALNGGIFGYSFQTPGGGSYYGNWSPVFTINDDGTVASVANYYGQGTNPQVRSGKIDPAGVNKYTAANKTLEVSYVLVQGGADRSLFTETLVYKGPR